MDRDKMDEALEESREFIIIRKIMGKCVTDHPPWVCPNSKNFCTQRKELIAMSG